jgi:hypothetical protein
VIKFNAKTPKGAKAQESGMEIGLLGTTVGEARFPLSFNRDSIPAGFWHPCQNSVRFGVHRRSCLFNLLCINTLKMEPVAGFEPAGGKGKSPIFHRKTRVVKTGANSSAATANAVTVEFSPSIDRKKGRFFGLFCR